jgi:hypothetical protein
MSKSRPAALPRAVVDANSSTRDEPKAAPAADYPANTFRGGSMKHAAFEQFCRGAARDQFLVAVEALGAKPNTAKTWYATFVRFVAERRASLQKRIGDK